MKYQPPLWLTVIAKEELKNQSHELNLELIGPFTCASQLWKYMHYDGSWELCSAFSLGISYFVDCSIHSLYIVHVRPNQRQIPETEPRFNGGAEISRVEGRWFVLW